MSTSFHQHDSASTPASRPIFVKQYLAVANPFLSFNVNILLASAVCITAQSGLHAVMIANGLRNGVRESALSGFLGGRYAGIDVAAIAYLYQQTVIAGSQDPASA